MYEIIKQMLIKHKNAVHSLQTMLSDEKKEILLAYSQALRNKQKQILAENEKDIAYARKIGCDEAFINRLTLTAKKITAIANDVKNIATFEDPVGCLLEKKKLPNGIILEKIAVPLGNIFIIYESRPDATVHATALCLKSSNGVILRGGSEAINSNKILIHIFHEVLKGHGISPYISLFIDSSDRTIVKYLLKQDKFIDVVIPRGGYKFVKMVQKFSQIPVLAHSQGGARIYIDKSADLTIALSICLNAKINQPATCNSVDTVIIHEAIAESFIPKLYAALDAAHVLVIGDVYTSRLVSTKKATETDWNREFLSLQLTIKVVSSEVEAISFIQKYTKYHSEGIVATDKKVIDLFTRSIDAAALFVNCSTRLHDGSIFGMGNEMGIATGKLHTRGPVGLNELTTIKWIACGSGQIREQQL